MNELVLANRQRACRVDRRRLRALMQHLLVSELTQPEHELGVHLVNAREITRLNEQFLRHAGPTDIITFDYTSELEGNGRLHGEMFICMEETIRQAHRYHTTWQKELARCLVHGLLHLLGYDDEQPTSRRRMKQQENRLLRRLSRRFDLHTLAA